MKDSIVKIFNQEGFKGDMSFAILYGIIALIFIVIVVLGVLSLKTFLKRER